MTPDPKNQKRWIFVMLMLVLSTAFLGRFMGFGHRLRPGAVGETKAVTAEIEAGVLQKNAIALPYDESGLFPDKVLLWNNAPRRAIWNSRC